MLEGALWSNVSSIQHFVNRQKLNYRAISSMLPLLRPSRISASDICCGKVKKDKES